MSISNSRVLLVFGAGFLVLVLVVGLFAISGEAQTSPINAGITVTRTTGVAPLGVVFEGHINTTHTGGVDPFLDLFYKWNFGDTTSGTWSVGPDQGDDKNIEYGPISAHVYEKPGTYTVILQVWDAQGNTDTTSMQIVVQNPNSVFSGTNTRCVSTSGNFTGCPVGADKITSSNFKSSISHCSQANRRCLFRAGETFAGGGGSSFKFAGPTSIGVYGNSGESYTQKATISGVAFNLIDYGANNTQNHRLWGFNIPMSSGGKVVDTGDSNKYGATTANRKNNLIHKITSDGGSGTIGGWVNDASYGLQIGLIISEITGGNWVGGGGNNGLTFGGQRSALIGSDLYNSEGVEHVARIPTLQRSVISHTRFERQHTSKSCMKLHAGNYNKGFWTEQVYIARNLFKNGPSNGASWCGTFESQNNTSDERLRKLRFEENTIDQTLGGAVSGNKTLRFGAQDSVLRNNVCVAGSQTSSCIQIANRGANNVVPTNVQVYNTSCYGNSSAGSFTCVNTSEGGPTATCKNNLAYAAGGTVTPCNNASISGGHVSAISNPYISSVPTKLSDFALNTGASAINAGVSVPNYFDAAHNVRPQGGTYDAGAYESGSGGAPPPPPSDTISPTVSITSPTNSATVTGTITLSATASDNVGIGSVQFSIDGQLIATDTNIPYTTTIDTTSYANGAHTLKATAYDTSGNNSSQSISVTVNNTVTPPPPPPTGSGLIGAWGFDEGSGATASDSVGSANATFFGSPSWSLGNAGQSVSLDGSSDGVLIGSPSVVNDLGSFTIAGWINPTQLGGYVFSKRSSGQSGYWRLALGNDGSLVWIRDTNGSTLFSNGQAGAVSTNSWQHVAVTWDGTLTASGARIYVDGVDIITSGTNGSGTLLSDAGNRLTLGYRDGGSEYFAGRIDDVRLYDRTLTATEVQSLAGGGTTPPPSAVCGNGIVEGGEACDGSALGGASCTSAGFSGGTLSCNSNCTFNTTQCSNPPSSDTTPPAVSITSPTNGATVSGTITITATASDASGIMNVVFSVDGTTVKTDTSSPYSATIDTTAYTDTVHTVTVLATDSSSNNNTNSVSMNITVDNQTQTGSVCGNGIIEGTEACDGSNLGNNTCSTAGFTGGTLTCSSSCTLVTSQCTNTPPPTPSTKFNPGDRVQVDTNGSKLNIRSLPGGLLGQQADGATGIILVWSTVINGNHSWNIDFDTGTDGWAAEDFLIDEEVTVPVGPICGNGVIETNEQCDGSALGGASCTSAGFSGGTVSCTSNCTFNTTQCTQTLPPPESNTVNTISFVPVVDGGATEGKNLSLKIFDQDTTNIRFQDTQKITNSVVTFTGINISASVYDLHVKVPRHLRKRIDGVTLIDGTQFQLPSLPGGDLNDDGVVNSLDWSLMTTVWGTGDVLTDINDDGVVNSIDFSYLNKNWGLADQ